MKKSLIITSTQSIADLVHVIAATEDEPSDCSTEDDLLVTLRDYVLSLDMSLILVGQHYPLTVDNDMIIIDLLFYHHIFHCYFVVEVMTCTCSPKDASQLVYNLAVVDHLLASPADKPSIGLFIHQKRKKVTARYAIRTEETALTCTLVNDQGLPEVVRGLLPSTFQLEAALRKK